MRVFELLAVFCISGLIAVSGIAAADSPTQRLVIFHAGSLSVPFAKMEKAFEAAYPHIDVVRTAGGSTKMARLISVDRRPADIMVSADYTVIDKNLIPDYATWNICFATNQLVLCYTDKSRHAGTITADNWYDILARKNVSWGHSDPNLDPCGYRSLMVLQLAEKHYAKPGLYDRLMANRPVENVRPKAKELVQLLKAGSLDYGWEYLSVAVQHGLNYLTLPAEINLGNAAHDGFYSQATVKVTGKKPGTWVVRKGKSCTYGITMTTDAKNAGAAQDFISYLLDPERGLKVLADMGQPPIVPCRVSAENMRQAIPASLQKWVEAKN